MAGVRRFEDLICWQKAREFCKTVYRLTHGERFAADTSLVDQSRRSSVSVMANIAEGFGRGTQGEFVTFLGYSLGSLNETLSHLCVAYDQEVITRQEFRDTYAQGLEVRRVTLGFISGMRQPGGGVKYSRKQVDFAEWVWQLHEKVTGRPRPPMFRKQKPED